MCAGYLTPPRQNHFLLASQAETAQIPAAELGPPCGPIALVQLVEVAASPQPPSPIEGSHWIAPAPRWPLAPGVVTGVEGAGPGVSHAQTGDPWSWVSHSLTHGVALRESLRPTPPVPSSVKWAALLSHVMIKVRQPCSMQHDVQLRGTRGLFTAI